MFLEYAAKITKTNHSNQIFVLINYSEKPFFYTKMTSWRAAGLQNDTWHNARPMDIQLV